MIKFRVAVPLIIASLASAGSTAERRYLLSDFDKIRVVGAATVIVETARATTVSARGDRDAIEALSLEVRNRVLTVQPLARINSNAPRVTSGPATVFVTVPTLDAAKLSGSGILRIAELRGLQAEVSLTGSGQITVTHIAVDRLTARLSGSGTLMLAGRSQSVDANVAGSGTLAAGGLIAADLKLTVASSGDVKIGARRSAAVISTGAGTVEIMGTPSCTVQNLGAGTVNCGKAK